jgi:peptidoglycan/LPS O-acetylase OafA/YrhL
MIAAASAAFIPSPRAKDDGTLSSFVLCLALGTAIPFFRECPDGWLTRTAYQIAKHSYSIYLTHEPIMWLAFDKLHAASPIQWTVFVILMTAIPVVLFRYVEHPMIRLGTRCAERLTRGIRAQASLPARTQLKTSAATLGR